MATDVVTTVTELFLNTVEWSWQQKDEVLVENPPS